MRSPVIATSVAAVVLTATLAGPAGADVYVYEIEPNGSAASATPVGAAAARARGTILPGGDVDYWSFAASAGDRVYAATMTAGSASLTSDSLLDLLASDGTTLLESDNDNGTFGGLASSIAGATIPVSGTYYIRARTSNGTDQLRPYQLYFRLQEGVPDAEVEPNDAVAQPLPSGWVAGATSSTSDVDLYSIALNAGDTVFLSLDLDPERDGTEWNGRLGLGPFAGNTLLANDAGGAGTDSEAFFMKVTTTGSYTVAVTSMSLSGTYHLSVSVLPAAAEGSNCTTYTSTDVPRPIADVATTSSMLVVPGHPRIADVDVSLQLSHALPADLDVHLVSPSGNENGLFTDIGSNTFPNLSLTLDDEGALPAGTFTVLNGAVYQPELSYRLSWFDGEDAGGTWALVLRDDKAGDGGTLQGWSLTICQPLPAAGCPPGHDAVTVYSADFEAGDGGFTHVGLQDEWQLGLPGASPITTCHSGTSCWKTDLTGTYNASCDQDLFSPAIPLPPDLAPPILVSWAQRYQMENANADHYFVEVRDSGGANPTRLFTWQDATMTDTVGSGVTVQESAGWGRVERRIDAYAGQTIELRFHLDSDASTHLAGAAVDDVEVRACAPWPSDVIFKDGFE